MNEARLRLIGSLRRLKTAHVSGVAGSLPGGAKNYPPRARLEQIILLSMPAVIAYIVLYGLYYYLQNAWQLLAVAGGGLLGLLGLALSLLLNRRARPALAAHMVLLSLLLVLGSVPVFVEGLTPYIALTAVLVVIVTGARVLPGRWPTWLLTGAIFGIAIWAADRQAVLPRYPSGASTLTSMYLLGVSATFLGLILWQSTLAPLRAATTIRARLLITSLVLVLFGGGAVSYFSTVVLMHAEQQEALDRLNAVATLREHEILDWTDKVQLALTLFAESARPQLLTVLGSHSPDQPDYAAAFQHLRADLTDTFVQSQLYGQLWVTDARGQVIASAGSGTPDSMSANMECPGRLASGSCLGVPRFYPSLGRVAIAAASAVTDQDGHLLGVISGYAKLDSLDKITGRSNGLGNTGVSYLVGADGTLLTSVFSGASADTAPAGPDVAHIQGVEDALRTHSSGSAIYQGLRGVPVIGAFRWIPNLQAALLAEQNSSEALEQATMLLNVDIGITVMILAVAAFTMLYLVRTITAPLSQLASAAEQIAEGAVDLTADVKQADEIGALARVFNRMTGRLLQAREQLEERSADLARVNTNLQLENDVRKQTEHALQLERNKLKGILDAMDDGVYIVNPEYGIEYSNPALTREFGPLRGRKCYEYLYARSEPCPWCPNDLVWQGVSVRREQTLANDRTYELFDTPVENGNGRPGKLAIFHDVTARKHAEEGILQRNRELATLSRRLVEIQESERHYISRELHDETGQALTSLMLRLGILERDLHQGAPLADRMTDLKQTVEEVLQGLHDLAVDLRPPSLDHVGLLPALRQQAERITERHGLIVDFGSIGFDEERLPQEMEITIYRIVQEALTNAVRHAEARHADVILEKRSGRVRVVIEDDGRGFDVGAALASGRLGLLGMRERVEMLAGRLVIDSAPGAGATVVAEIPLDRTNTDS